MIPTRRDKHLTFASLWQDQVRQGVLGERVIHYEIHVAWDNEADVWYVEDSNVPGLVGEATRLEAMIALRHVRVPEMLEENGCPSGDDIPLRLLTTAHLAQIRNAA